MKCHQVSRGRPEVTRPARWRRKAPTEASGLRRRARGSPAHRPHRSRRPHRQGRYDAVPRGRRGSGSELGGPRRTIRTDHPHRPHRQGRCDTVPRRRRGSGSEPGGPRISREGGSCRRREPGGLGRRIARTPAGSAGGRRGLNPRLIAGVGSEPVFKRPYDPQSPEGAPTTVAYGVARLALPTS